ncbi:MAG: tricarballylate dehydrogenase [Rhodospirillaceae bacterium TMED8]|nr:tricarballylate dehydrogenase [Magnetovibrio sp.]OUT51419.1 MAG: tricarballylate dehydrogenase [Rhodospirillaceae bacterium TMED8]|tara:strand:- start:391 stop:1872 length:1482 start_codon:yes stop_codon:yes gene_type:complete
MNDYDVVVVGAGNAAFCAALAAAVDEGAHVAVLERAPEEDFGGNSRYTAGAIRFAHQGLEDLETIIEINAEERLNTDFGEYTANEFYDDMYRITNYRCDADLVEALVTRSLPTLQWMREKGIRFQPSYGRQAFKVNGKYKFWGGLCVETWGGGPGLVETQLSLAKKAGIDVLFETRVLSLLYDEQSVHGVRVKERGKVRELRSKTVILASGGFEANAEMRTRYLGPGWELAKVRGTKYNTGDGIRMALDIGAMPYGNWSGCHSVGWDFNAPPYGDLEVGDNFQKHSYPLGIIVNADGNRFVDEGADFRNYTYAKYGGEILKQRNQLAWQIFDQKVTDKLRDEYRIRQITKVTADTIEELSRKLEGVNSQQFMKTVEEYNSAVMEHVVFDPTILDGRGTKGLLVPKSNWANKLDQPPFEAYQITCGITFTFGGLKIDPHSGQVMDVDMHPIDGLYAAGELVGGLFFFNYPGGTGLTSGAVFGRMAGLSAGQAAK